MIARLVAHLQLNSRQFQGGLNTTRGMATKWASSMRGIISGAVAGIGIYKGIQAIKNQFTELDKLAKLSRTTDFGAATIAGLGFAAEQNGSSVEGMNKGLQTFSRRMGEAEARGGPVLDTLKQMGLDFDALKAMSPEDQLLTFADGLGRLPTAAGRANAAYQLMGRQGQELVNTLSQGRAGLQGFISEAENLGLGFDAQELARVEEANDAVNRVKRSMGGLFGSVAIGVAPMVEDFAAAIRTAMDWFKSWGNAGAESVGFVVGWWDTLQHRISQGITIAMTVAEFAMTNWQNIGKLAITNVMLSVVKFGGVVGHFFGTQMPAYLTFFASNWKSIFFTAFDLVSTIFINMGINIRRIMGEIWDFIASGGTASFEVAWTPLTDGFVNTISKLPDIPPRLIGPLEKQLQAESQRLGTALGGGLKQELTDRLNALDDIVKQERAQKAAKLAAAQEPSDNLSSGGDSSGPESANSGGDKSTTFGALSGAAAFTASVQAMFRSQNDPALQTAKDQLKAEKAANGKLDALNESVKGLQVVGTIEGFG